MLTWMRRGLDSHTSMSAALGALDEIFNPGAARSHEELKEHHERVIPTPSPGDRMLTEGRVRIRKPPAASAGAE
jgi:hypothetical protein